MTVAIETETRIARPVDDVFAALVDVEHYPAWLIASGIRSVERAEPGALRVGSRLRIQQSVAGRASVLDARVTSLESGRRFGLAGGDRDGVTVEIEADVRPVTAAAAANAAAATGNEATADAADPAAAPPSVDPATLLRWRVKLGLPLRFRMFESMVTPQARRAAALDVEALRQRLEAAAPR